MKSVSGVVYIVADLKRTKDFYEALGFIFKDQSPKYLTAYLNWFWLEFHQGDAGENKSGPIAHISVDNVDEFYQELILRHLKLSGPPRDLPFDRRELSIQDPDGYKLVFFQKT